MLPKLSKKERKSILRAFALITVMGVSVVICLGMGIFIGWLLDRWLGTGPWLLMVFSVLGIFAAIKAMYDMAKRAM